jgi:hypothetical protein
LAITPGGPVALDENLADLWPRNHLYVSAGTTNLPVTFALDTTTLPDGFHELTAVAYEGSSVHSQTHFTLPVRIQNTPLEATLDIVPSLPAVPVTNALEVTVAANTNVVSEILEIQLYGTGGRLASATNQTAVTFPVQGPDLGVGAHPFYAMVTATNGWRYRTETRWIELTPP